MPKLVHEHDPEERQDLKDVVDRRIVTTRGFQPLVAENRDDKPGPVQVDTNPGKTKEADRAVFSRQHVGEFGGRGRKRIVTSKLQLVRHLSAEHVQWRTGRALLTLY